MLGRFARDMARQGIQSGSAGCSGSAATPPGPCTRPTPQRLPSAATSAVRRVWRVPHYVGYLAAGQALAAGSPWESGRFRVDAVLRCLMAAAQLSDLTGRLASIWIADLNHPDGRPDRGLALIDASVIETVPAPETFGLHGSPSPPERDRYYSAVAGSLTAVGIPTLDAAAVRRYVEALIDDVVDLAPAMRARISLDDTREEVTDDLQEHARERLYLHTSPLPWSWSTRQSCRGGRGLRPPPSPGRHPHIAGLDAAGPAGEAVHWAARAGPGTGRGAAAGYARRRSGPSGQSVRTAQLHREMDPGPCVRAMVVLTTASTLMVSPSDICCW